MFFTLILLSSPIVFCCNLYNDFCDNMESSMSEVVRARRQAVVSGGVINMTREEVGRHVSMTLDTLFGNGYNKQLRPGTEGRPTIVEVNIAIR